MTESPSPRIALDQMGKRILRNLGRHVAIDSAALARDLGASEEVVRQRLDSMRQAGLVQGVQVRVDGRLLGDTYEFLVTGVPTGRTSKQAIANLCTQPGVTRVFGLAASHSVAFTLVGHDLAKARSEGLELAQQAGLDKLQVVLIVATFEDRAGTLLPENLGAEPCVTLVTPSGPLAVTA